MLLGLKTLAATAGCSSLCGSHSAFFRSGVLLVRNSEIQALSLTVVQYSIDCTFAVVLLRFLLSLSLAPGKFFRKGILYPEGFRHHHLLAISSSSHPTCDDFAAQRLLRLLSTAVPARISLSSDRRRPFARPHTPTKPRNDFIHFCCETTV